MRRVHGGKVAALIRGGLQGTLGEPRQPGSRGPAEPAGVSRGHSTLGELTRGKGRTRKRGLILVRSRGMQGKQPSRTRPYPQKVAVKPRGYAGEQSMPPAQA